MLHDGVLQDLFVHFPPHCALVLDALVLDTDCDTVEMNSVTAQLAQNRVDIFAGFS